MGAENWEYQEFAERISEIEDEAPVAIIESAEGADTNFDDLTEVIMNLVEKYGYRSYLDEAPNEERFFDMAEIEIEIDPETEAYYISLPEQEGLERFVDEIQDSMENKKERTNNNVFTFTMTDGSLAKAKYFEELEGEMVYVPEPA